MWTCGVDRFSQCVKKFESKAILLQTSAPSELSLLSSTGKQSAMLPVHITFFPLILPELQILSRAD